ncbi:MAG: response regulator [Candidatus Omnitrophica bacterium CG11_big_fil_rev_8_21_14_0_20_45_26]|uniref:Response regulator n=1 Tax=Candidatus Abzuiibacterium crystallinum TaxID=1974748 RepID=A0A2H0LQI4_9BACT|nr:MAG: response regulator [Candidatus Omnitrophica bacterium CG11_big_fil_rev_8_21_14_0_20_45_26]PIW64381.1 MAG: response regulator [Candidatus Omnitrophica bacterium CG12_big_fil_rev_8_21_14_0_65_45_16]
MNKKRILIIDDDEELDKTLKVALEETGGYEVEWESKSDQALGMVKRFHPDFIFLDIMMPGMCGTEIGRQISEDEEIRRIPIAYLTAIVSRAEVDSRSGVIGGHPFLAKPVSLTELVSCIRQYLG